ncbi:MAG: aminotransferase class V-fold PLP-dependent enzyme [SAR324 cluster bacterium]|nr:aminotransferase class V-fold PLP-dependent enzyme [SAR324 cluster bacterium]
MTDNRRDNDIETTLIHGVPGPPDGYGATLPPLVYSTAFEHDSAEDMEAVFMDRQPGHIYSRLQNPTVQKFEERISATLAARGTLAVASGMSAITLGLLAMLKAGDEIAVGKYLFGGSYSLFTRTLPDLGITAQFFDPRSPEAAAELITPKTKGVFLEAVANPAMVVPDFSAYREICEGAGIPLLADASLLTPYLFDADRLGVDLAFFSASKYIAGPASTVGGLIVDTGRFPWHERERFDFGDLKRLGEQAYLTKLRKLLMAGVGPALAPMNAFLLLLGLDSLPLRMDRQSENAQAVAEFLQGHSRVRQVLYPGLPDDEFHHISKAQFKNNCGAVAAFRLADKAACFSFLNRLRLVKRAVNLGDTKSIALHPASTIYGTFWPHEQEQLGVTEDMIRLSVGLESPADIIADLDQALQA